MYLVECYSDENLLLGLGVPGRSIRRMRGKGNVVRFLTERATEPCVALLDRDRNEAQPKDLRLFELVSTVHGASLYTWRGHKLVMLDDNLEDWLVRVVRQSGARMGSFDLPDDVGALHRIEPRVGDERFAQVVGHLLTKRSPAINTLREYLGLQA